MAKKQSVTSDERFKNVHNDPRFKLPKRHDFKMEIDDRFQNSDLTSIKKKSKIDKYGRKVEDKHDTFDKYFKKNDRIDKKKVIEESEDEDEDEDEVEDEESEDESEDDEEQEQGTLESVEESEEEDESLENDLAVSKLDRARGKGIDADSSGDESSSDESSSDEESESEEESEEEEDEKPEETDPSKRIAVVNLDWDHVKSIDLMATFQSFVPEDGLIENISIYPSEFGKERMQREDIEGPPRDVFKKKSKKSKKQDVSDDDSDSEIEAKDLYEEGDGTEDYDSKSLRNYQLQRLRYYYAVVTCDSIRTAKNIYDKCDGTEYESTANIFDLRFVPDEMDFDDKPRDTCEKIPSNYKPDNFVTDALQHSKVKLTWDETPAERVTMSSKAFSQRQLDDMDFKAYLASDNSDNEEESQNLKDRYKNLVSSSTKIGNKDIFAKDNDDKDDIDMEITFTPGLDENAGSKKVPEAGADEESTIDKLKRKAKERRKSRKDKVKELKDQEVQQRKAAKAESKAQSKKGNTKEDAKSKAELELLMLDEENGSSKSQAQHFNLKELVRSEKEKGKKTKHRNKEKIIEDDFKADLNDPRFKEIFTNHDFAIDPSQPQFKKTSTMNKILEERNKRRDDGEVSKKTKQDKTKKRKLEEVSGSNDVHSLVQKLKRKSHK